MSNWAVSPHAFTHLSLIDAAIKFNAGLDNPRNHNRLSARLHSATSHWTGGGPGPPGPLKPCEVS